VDSAGQAKADVQLSPSVDLLRYLKGFYGGPSAWTRTAPDGFTGPSCSNEDLNRNGVNDQGDDLNENGQLDPRKADVAVSFEGSSKTDASGAAIIRLTYPKNIATWVEFSLQVAASGVSGTEGRDTWVGGLPASADEFTAEEPPSFVLSPYGIGDFDTNGDSVINCADAD
jgi:hypothetical protein